MGTRTLPDMYALSPRACSPWASGMHIRQSTRAYVITINCNATFRFQPYISGKSPCPCKLRRILRYHQHITPPAHVAMILL